MVRYITALFLFTSTSVIVGTPLGSDPHALSDNAETPVQQISQSGSVLKKISSFASSAFSRIRGNSGIEATPPSYEMLAEAYYKGKHRVEISLAELWGDEYAKPARAWDKFLAPYPSGSDGPERYKIGVRTSLRRKYSESDGFALGLAIWPRDSGKGTLIDVADGNLSPEVINNAMKSLKEKFVANDEFREGYLEAMGLRGPARDDLNKALKSDVPLQFGFDMGRIKEKSVKRQKFDLTRYFLVFRQPRNVEDRLQSIVSAEQVDRIGTEDAKRNRQLNS